MKVNNVKCNNVIKYNIFHMLHQSKFTFVTLNFLRHDTTIERTAFSTWVVRGSGKKLGRKKITWSTACKGNMI